MSVDFVCPWLPIDVAKTSRQITALSKNDLLMCCNRLDVSPQGPSRRKVTLASAIVDEFVIVSESLFSMSLSDVLSNIEAVSQPAPLFCRSQSCSLQQSIFCYFQCRFGMSLLENLVGKGAWSVTVYDPQPCVPFGMSWLSIDRQIQIGHISKLKSTFLRLRCIGLGIPLPKKTPDCLSMAALIRSDIDQYAASIQVLSHDDLRRELSIIDPTCDEGVMSVEDVIGALMSLRYGPEIFAEIRWNVSMNVVRRRRTVKKELNESVKLEQMMADQKRRDSWPQVVPNEVITSCCMDYLEGTSWERPLCCASCARRKSGMSLIDVEVPDDCEELPLDMELLRLTDLFVIKSCVIQQSSPEFVFGHSLLDGLMLEKEGIADSADSGKVVTLCSDCHGSLSRGKLPKFALKNGLYRGSLPDRFKDLTWVEEMICSIYRNTAHVTRLFDAKIDSQARVLRGNTCAHEMNVLSTAECLPRTPSDVNNMISIVFIGTAKLDATPLCLSRRSQFLMVRISTPLSSESLFYICFRIL